MESILTPQNLKVLESFSIVKTLYAFDYDGTLAAITDNPDEARMSPEVAEMLARLNAISPVAIITGRSVDDLRKLLPFEPAFIIGNHGIEGAQLEFELEPIKALCHVWKKTITDLPKGAWLEDKTYSLTIHYKNSGPEIFKLIKDLPGSSIIEGKRTFNILPVTGVNKGQALDILMRRNKLHFGFYVGDDKTDETVFAYKHSRLLTVKVGNDPESYAKYFIESQNDIKDLLTAILSFQKKLS